MGNMGSQDIEYSLSCTGMVSGSNAYRLQRGFRGNQKYQKTQKPSWWRGMGFGFIGIFPSLPKGMEACVDDIDVRENAKGTWQWSVICLKNEKAAVGAHMWMQGYLTPAYQQILSQLKADGYKVASFKKEKDKLTEFLTCALQLPEFQNKNNSQSAP